jgi:DNA polymerase III subunit epsilon
MLREIVLDTETTGLDHAKGDRLIELGCIELINRVPSGVEFHRFINPETRDVHPDAERVHGISTASLKDKPVFKLLAAEFLDFIGDTPLVIHNAPFDIGFINMELERLRLKPIDTVRVIDTLPMARRKHPAGPNSLDALCKRYNIDTRNRTKHGAIVDSLLLSQVYLELLGERQSSLGFGGSKDAAAGKSNAGAAQRKVKARQRPDALPSRLSADDATRHAEFVQTLGANAAWLKTRS